MKDIKNYEGLYAITEDGQVWSYRSNRFLTPHKEKGGYLQIRLYKNGCKKTFKIHRLMMETYCPNENANILDVDHIDFDVINNCLSNLRWIDRTENRKRHKGCKKTRCVETNIIYPSANEAARQTGLKQSSISNCCNGKAKTTGGFHWEYVE